jgi:hypothetical protein
MFLVRKDIKQNRLYLTIQGVISVSDALQIKEQIVKEVEELQPGFCTINDMSKFIKGDDTSAPILKWVIAFLLKKEVEYIVRIIGTSKTGLMQFAKNSPQDQNLKIKYVPTLKEAEKLLSELKSQNN